MGLLKKQTLSGKIVGLVVLAILILSGTIFVSTYFLIYRNIDDSEQTSRTSAELARLSKDLREIISGFKV